MTQFVQLHWLTAYPPSNLNRDDLNRPKTAYMGGTQRLRISSQSLKRAWRTSPVYEKALDEHLGKRTKEMGRKIHIALVEGIRLQDVLKNKESGERRTRVPDESARKWAGEISGVFGKRKKGTEDDPLQELEIEQLAHFSPEELAAIDELLGQLAAGKIDLPEKKELERRLLREEHTAVDIAMFGRMLADAPKFNTEAAIQVAHAITVHEVTVEDDFFSAVDDLNEGKEDAGAAHLGEVEFGSGLFYHYICVNRELLVDNLKKDAELAGRALRALVEAALTVAPTGKQNSFASRSRAMYALAEKGNQQPRSLSVSFLRAINDKELLGKAIEELESTYTKLDTAYGKCAEERQTMNVPESQGTLQELLDFVVR